MTNESDKLREAMTKARELGLEVEKGGAVVLNENLLYKKLARDLEKMGVIYSEIHEAAREYPDLFDKHAFKMLKGDVNKIDSGIFLYIPKGLTVKEPIFNCFVLGNKKVVQKVYNLVVLEDGSRAIGVSGCFTLVNEAVHSSLEETYVGTGASYTRIMIHNWLPSVGVSAISSVEVGEKGNYQDLYINYSEAKSISFNTLIYQKGSDSTSRADQIVSGTGFSSLKYSTEVFLIGDRSSSQLISRLLARGKSSIATKARIVASGKLTKGHIECKGLTLGDGAEISTVPELRSLSNDAELTHEASIGKIKREELEYLESKGFYEEEAVSLLIRGFLETGFSDLPSTIKASVESVLDKLSKAKG